MPRVPAAFRSFTAVALAAGLACCGGTAPSPGEPVALLTGVDPEVCYAGGESGLTDVLVADPIRGTSFGGRPVMWPTGYTARRAGSEVEVLDLEGRVRATTGRTYHISIAPIGPDGDASLIAYPAAAECSAPWDFIDCTADPGNQYCEPA